MKAQSTRSPGTAALAYRKRPAWKRTEVVRDHAAFRSGPSDRAGRTSGDEIESSAPCEIVIARSCAENMLKGCSVSRAVLVSCRGRFPIRRRAPFASCPESRSASDAARPLPVLADRCRARSAHRAGSLVPRAARPSRACRSRRRRRRREREAGVRARRASSGSSRRHRQRRPDRPVPRRAPRSIPPERTDRARAGARRGRRPAPPTARRRSARRRRAGAVRAVRPVPTARRAYPARSLVRHRSRAPTGVRACRPDTRSRAAPPARVRPTTNPQPRRR